MSDPIIITAIYDINTGRDRIEITDSIAAEIVRRALVHDDTVRAGIKGLVQRLEDNTKPPEAVSHDDDATVDAMALVLLKDHAPDYSGTPTRADWAFSPFPGRAKNIIAAIRRGEVPGLQEFDHTIHAKYKCAVDEVTRLRAQLKEEDVANTAHRIALVEDRDAARLMVDELWSKLDSIQSALGVPMQNVGDERVDEVHAIERIRSKLAEVEDAAKRDRRMADDAQERTRLYINERDAARAELAAAKAEVDATLAKAEALHRDLVATKAQLEQSMLAAGETQDALKRECAEHNATKGALDVMKEKYDAEFEAWAASNRALDDMKEQNVMLNAELHVMKLSVSEWHADSERLSVEVAALKQCLDPRKWQDRHHAAWHGNLPDLRDSFAALSGVAGVEVA